MGCQVVCPSGGPIKSVVTRVAKAAAGEAITGAKEKIRTGITTYLKDDVGVNPWVADLLGHGAVFAIDAIISGPKEVIDDAKNVRSFDKAYGKKLQGHHADPKFMGGAKKQDRVYISGKEHHELHNDLNAFLKKKTNAAGQDMMPRRGNSGKVIRNNFAPDERVQAMREFYLKFETKYPKVAEEFFKMHGRK